MKPPSHLTPNTMSALAAYDLTPARVEQLEDPHAKARYDYYGGTSRLDKYRARLGGKLPCEETGQTLEESKAAARAYARLNGAPGHSMEYYYKQYMKLVTGAELRDDGTWNLTCADAWMFQHEAAITSDVCTPEVARDALSVYELRTEQAMIHMKARLPRSFQWQLIQCWLKLNATTRNQPDRLALRALLRNWTKEAREFGHWQQSGLDRALARHPLLGRDLSERIGEFVSPQAMEDIRQRRAVIASLQEMMDIIEHGASLVDAAERMLDVAEDIVQQTSKRKPLDDDRTDNNKRLK